MSTCQLNQIIDWPLSKSQRPSGQAKGEMQGFRGFFKKNSYQFCDVAEVVSIHKMI